MNNAGQSFLINCLEISINRTIKANIFCLKYGDAYIVLKSFSATL